MTETTRAMSRRTFINRLGSVGGTALVLAGMEAFGMGIRSAQAAPPALAGGGRGKRVVILGAGVAGLTSAYELTKAGYTVQVIEARSFAGGRSQTARKGFELTELGGEKQVCDFDPGLYINHGPWRIPFHQRSTLHYVKEFGVELELFNNDNDASYLYFTKGTGPLTGKPFRKMELAADMRGYADEFLAKATKGGKLDAPMGADEREMFVEYLIGEGYLSPKDLDYTGTEGRGWVTKPGAGLQAGTPSKPHSLEDLLHSGAWRTLRSVSDWDQQRTMFQPKGGMYMLPMGFAKHVGHLIRYSTVVEKIRQSDAGVEISVVDGAGQRSSVTGDYCICTIPLSVLKGIDNGLSQPMKAAMNGVAYAPVGKIGLQMKRRFWEEDHWIYGGHVYTDDPAINSISLPSTGWQGQKGVLLGYYQFASAAAKVSALSPADRAKMAVAFGQKVFPEYQSSFETAFSVAWHRVQYNLGGWGVWSDEARARDYPVLLQPDGRIYLAGEHLSHIGGWQAGGIESAWAQIAGAACDGEQDMRSVGPMRTMMVLAIALLEASAVGAADPAVDGHETFTQNCSACHQTDGKGIPGAFPALAGDPFVLGDPAAPVGVVLNGRAGMPTFRDELTDAQIAAALSYVRASWGNKAGAVDPKLVATLRGGTMKPAKPDPLQAH